MPDTAPCVPRPAPAALTFVEAPRGQLIQTAISYFHIDMEEKNVSVPEFNRRSFAINAMTSDGLVAGSCCGMTGWTECRVEMLCASPDVVVPGVGTVLMNYVEELADQHGCKRVAFTISSWQSMALFERLGYRKFATHHDYPKGHEMYFYEKLLQPDGKRDVTPFALSGKAAPASELTVADGDNDEITARLRRWLDDDARSRTIAGVPSYERKEFGLEARLPDDSLAAVACFETAWGELHISFFACNDKLKRQGIGGTFLRHLFEVARQNGCYRLSLETMSWQAQPFYEKFGFRVVGVQDGLPAPQTSRILMDKVL